MNESIWARPRPGNENSNYFPRPDDWSCSSCGFSNFQRRVDCMQCSRSKAGTPTQQSFLAPKEVDGNIVSNWYQPNTNSSLAPISTLPAQKPTAPKLGGMADSLWAPRSLKGRAKKSDTWIRKPSQNYDYSNTNTGGRTTISTSSTPPDLGLPYEVQHFILAMIQRILEEGCYDFAYRWIPGTLNDRNWSCPEAVELSVWRDFLPNASLPSHALVTVPQYTLRQALIDAVRIRNAAVHRHLCDNTEIQQMAQQAQNLMTIFRDGTRQSKFYRLWEELECWDTNSKGDTQAARRQLEQALQEISERPMDDMDWTPNAVSLHEITGQVEQALHTLDYEDAMEID
ncbi:putative RNA-binding [Hyphodiscus hymeniophilus]|uniref:RNA-binding n=1 Tax=Hyphodiscus hymeniophilus TaxID=353542 RepID=A0A9P7AY51_9HELO|nr:putative RNA-binding [Hyphodiscus hymeniophilus]